MNRPAAAAQHDTTSGLITAIVNLVGTGPVPLGAYTVAEIFSVGGLLEFLEQEPSQDAISEAVRSLAARDLITTEPGDEYIEVRGDLGIAVGEVPSQKEVRAERMEAIRAHSIPIQRLVLAIFSGRCAVHKQVGPVPRPRTDAVLHECCRLHPRQGPQAVGERLVEPN